VGRPSGFWFFLGAGGRLGSKYQALPFRVVAYCRLIVTHVTVSAHFNETGGDSNEIARTKPFHRGAKEDEGSAPRLVPLRRCRSGVVQADETSGFVFGLFCSEPKAAKMKDVKEPLLAPLPRSVLRFLTFHVGVEVPSANADVLFESSGEYVAEVASREGVLDSLEILDDEEVPVDPEVPLVQTTPEERLHAARFLFSLSAIDALSWVVGKAMQFEALQLAEDIDISYVRIALLLTTVEVAVEFLASSLSPVFYKLLQNAEVFTAKNLSEAALKAYGVSCVTAIIVYPILGSLIYFVFGKSVATLAALIIIHAFQYPFLNQVGDSLREMSQVHWLHTAQGLDLVVPGASWGLRRRASADALAVYLQMSFLLISFIYGAFYTLVRDYDAGRWISVMLVALLNVFLSGVVYKNLSALTSKVVDSIHDQDSDSMVIWPWKLKGFERALITLLIVVIAVPEQAYNSLLAVLILDLEGFLATAAAAIAFGVVFVFLLFRVKALPIVPKTHITDEEVQDTNKRSYANWMLSVGGVLLTLAGGAVGLYLIDGTVGIVISLISFVAVRPFLVQFRTLTDGFLFLYNGQRASNIRLWINVATVLVNGPLLGLNWWAVGGGLDALRLDVVSEDENGETSPEEQKQAAVTLILSIFIIGLTLAYFVFIDPFLCSAASSLSKAVGRTPKHAM